MCRSFITLLLIALAIAITYAIKAFKEKETLHLFKSGALAVFAGVIGLGLRL
jgi:hypothetical protein